MIVVSWRKKKKYLVACRSGNIEDVKECMSNGVEVTCLGGCGWTGLHKAAEGNSVEVCKLLVAKGIDGRCEE